MRQIFRLSPSRIVRAIPVKLNRHTVVRALAATGAFGVVVGLLVAVMMPVPVAATAGINQQINFQGRLLTNTGAVVADGNYNMRFKIYCDGDGVLGGTDPGSCTAHATNEHLLWTETRQNSASAGVAVKNGYFSVQLGSVASLSGVDFNQSTLWLSMELTTNGTDTGGSPTYNGEMTPYKRLASAVYAMNANQLGGLTSSAYAQLAATQTFSATNTFSNASGIVLSGTPASGGSLLQAGGALSSGSSSGTLIGANPASFSGDLVNLQVANSSKFKVDATGAVTSATSMLSPLFDVASAGALSIGTGTATSINIGKTGSNITTTVTGLAVFKPASDSATAFEVNNAANNTTIFDVDTSNQRVGVGTTAPTQKLHVSGTNNTTPITLKVQNTNGAPGAGKTEARLLLSTDPSVATDNGGAALIAHRTGGAGNGSADLYFQTSDASATPVLNTWITLSSTGLATFAGNLTVTAGASSLTGLTAGGSTALLVNTGAATNIGLYIQAVSSQSADLLRIKDGGGVDQLVVAASGSLATLYKPTGTGSAGSIMVGSDLTQTSNDINGVIGFPGSGVKNAQIAYSVGNGFYLCDSSASSAGGDYGQCSTRVNLYGGTGDFNGGLTVQGNSVLTGLTSGDALTLSNSTSTGNIMVLKDNTTAVLTVGDAGATTFQNETNQVSALRVLTTAATSSHNVFNVDTTNERVGVGGVASFSKFEVLGGDAAIYNSGSNPRLVLGDSTSGGQNGYLQWDSASDYFRVETVGTNGLKVKDNYVAIGNIFPSQPLIVGNGSTNLFQVSTTGATTQTSSDTGDAHTITANSLVAGSALKVISTTNSALNSAWSANVLNVTNAQSTTAVVTGMIQGLDLQFTQNTTVAGNAETVANFAVMQNNSSSTDNTVSSILNLTNNDTATGNQINVTDGLKIGSLGSAASIVNGITIAGGSSAVTNGLNFTGTLGGNLINAANFTVAQSGAIGQTYSAATASNAQTIAISNTNTGAGVTVQGVNLTPTNTSTASSGTNVMNVVNFAAGGALGGTDQTNGLNFASATGYTNFIKTPTAVLSSGGALSGITSLSGAGLTDCDAQNSKLLWDTTTSQFSCGTDRASVTIRKPTDETVNNSTALQNDDDFTFAVGAGETWAFQINAVIPSINAADFKFDFTTPASSTCEIAVYNYEEGNNGASNVCNHVYSIGHSNAVEDPYTFYGTVVTTASGSVTLRWAQDTAAVGNTTIRAGSYLVAYKISGADLAEAYYTRDDSIGPGDVVSVDGSLKAGVKKTDEGYDGQAIGVISTEPGQILAAPPTPGGRSVLVALAGRIPVKVTSENGPVKAGDYLTSSSIPGVAMKATRPGQTIGKALADYDEADPRAVGLVMMLANLSYYGGDGSHGDAGAAWLSNSGGASPMNMATAADLTRAVSELQGTQKQQQDQIGALQARVVALEGQGDKSGVQPAETLTVQQMEVGQGLLVKGTARLGNIVVADTTINSTSGALKLQTEANGNVEIMGGKVVVDTAGNLSVKGVVTAGKLKIVVGDPAEASIGEAHITAGQTQVIVPTRAVTPDSKIFITSKTKTDRTPSVTSQVPGQAFTVEMTGPEATDLDFNWWIIN